MATVINNPSGGTTTDSGSSMGFLAGMVILLIIVILAFYYGIPALRSAAGSVGGGNPQINVPEQVDVNVNGGQPQGQPQ